MRPQTTSTQAAATVRLARAWLAAGTEGAVAAVVVLGSLRLPPQPQRCPQTAAAPPRCLPVMRRLVSLLKPPAWVWMKGERDGGFEKCASSKPALT